MSHVSAPLDDEWTSAGDERRVEETLTARQLAVIDPASLPCGESAPSLAGGDDAGIARDAISWPWLLSVRDRDYTG
jgi:hypothetical protein